MKVVRRKSTGRLIYREIPEFIENKGIENVVKLFGYEISDLEEIEITQEEWNIEQENYPIQY